MAPLETLRWFEDRRDRIVADIAELARIESPSRDEPGVNRSAEWVADHAAGLFDVTRVPLSGYGALLRLERGTSHADAAPGVLGLGHLDTVYPVGTLETMPVRTAEGRLWGPGVFDMKGGVVYFLWAARALREMDVELRRPFVVQLNPDEEIGSPASRPYTNEVAEGAAAVLVAEPSYGREGRLKTARKGGGGFRVEVRGVASHAGLDFAAGASAVVELAKRVVEIASWTDLAEGVTVNPGVIGGGTGSNVVAERAWVEVDARVPTAAGAAELEAKFRALEADDPRTTVTVEGGLRRPPMERNEGIAKLFALAREISAEMGVELGEASVGGGSDGNFTAALGIPTLDGLGAVGEGAHSTHESIWLDRVADRAALITELITRI